MRAMPQFGTLGFDEWSFWREPEPVLRFEPEGDEAVALAAEREEAEAAEREAREAEEAEDKDDKDERDDKEELVMTASVDESEDGAAVSARNLDVSRAYTHTFTQLP